MKRTISLIFIALFTLTACDDIETENTVPLPKRELRKKEIGSLTGDEGILLSGRSKSDGDGAALGVNSYLWRATLDTLSFMPLASADPFGGVIITDWYEDPSTPGERFKVNALILDRTLRPDGVKISIFKQANRGGWRDQKTDNALARKLEDTILTRARQLKVSQIK